jgi:hypothetical protein
LVDFKHILAPDPAAFPMNLILSTGTSGYIPMRMALLAST